MAVVTVKRTHVLSCHECGTPFAMSHPDPDEDGDRFEKICVCPEFSFEFKTVHAAVIEDWLLPIRVGRFARWARRHGLLPSYEYTAAENYTKRRDRCLNDLDELIGSTHKIYSRYDILPRARS